MEFDKSKLDVVFKNIRQIDVNRKNTHHYVLRNENGNDVAQFVFSGGKELTVEIDNFPMQKQYFNTNFPICSNDEFINEMRRINLHIEKNQQAE